MDLTMIRALGLGNASAAQASLCARAGYLLKEGTAALLNAQDSTISFPLTPAQTIDAVNAALASCDPERIRDQGNQLEAFNKARCPLNTRSCSP
jgi:hypothetical protein